MELINKIKKHLAVDKKLRYRDRRAHYASSALSCRRDQYRSWMQEEPTNPTDFVGRMRMLVGNAVEAELIKSVFSDLHWYGIHLMGTQVQVGGTARKGLGSTFDGALDALVAEKQSDGSYRRFVVEIKTKSGYGADELMRVKQPSDEYAAQLGLYLRDLHSKGVTNEGCLFYVLLSDNNFGKMLQFNAKYDEKSQRVVFSQWTCSDGTTGEIEFSLSLPEIDARWAELEVALKEQRIPKPDYAYKYPLTEELLEKQSDSMLRRMLNGEKVLSDWQALYSPYKDKNIREDGQVLGYTEDELKVIREHYRRRHPKSKL